MYVRPATSYTSETSAAFQYDEKEVRLKKPFSSQKRKSYSPQSRPTKIRADHEPKRRETIPGKPGPILVEKAMDCEIDDAIMPIPPKTERQCILC